MKRGLSILLMSVFGTLSIGEATARADLVWLGPWSPTISVSPDVITGSPLAGAPVQSSATFSDVTSPGPIGDVAQVRALVVGGPNSSGTKQFFADVQFTRQFEIDNLTAVRLTGALLGIDYTSSLPGIPASISSSATISVLDISGNPVGINLSLSSHQDGSSGAFLGPGTYTVTGDFNVQVSSNGDNYGFADYSSFQGAGLTLNVVPEPGSIVMMGLGLVGIAAYNVRKRLRTLV